LNELLKDDITGGLADNILFSEVKTKRHDLLSKLDSIDDDLVTFK
jgi:hypothetical protein